MSVPRLVIPFRVGTAGHLVEAEQGTLDDDFSRVESVLRTRPGDRPENPGFGTQEAAFRPLPFDTGPLLAQIARSAPGTLVTVQENPDLLDALLTRLDVAVTDRG